MIGDTSFVPGLVRWIDVSSTDPAGSQDFYAGLFGCKQGNQWPGGQQQVGDGRHVDYTT